MGWANGSSVMQEIIEGVQKMNLMEHQRKDVFKIVASALMMNDWDTADECLGLDPAFDLALAEIYPEWFDPAVAEYPLELPKPAATMILTYKDPDGPYCCKRDAMNLYCESLPEDLPDEERERLQDEYWEKIVDYGSEYIDVMIEIDTGLERIWR